MPNKKNLRFPVGKTENDDKPPIFRLQCVSVDIPWEKQEIVSVRRLFTFEQT